MRDGAAARTDRTGLLLINLGTPNSPRPEDVRPYLNQFLSDPRVLDMPAWRRWLVLHLFILPFRPKASGEAYKKIWTERGSPLLFHSQDLAQKVQQRLGPQVLVQLAMRYGRPSIPEALAGFRRAGIDRIVAFPLYPQYSSAATGSSIEELFRHAAAEWNTPYLQVVPPFFDHPLFLDACARVARPLLDGTAPERVIFSFHGLPERHCAKSDESGQHCLKRPDCCDRLVQANRNCYRAQCFATARGLADLLGVPEEKRIVCFQSRLGRTPWIRPYTDEVVVRLAREGVKRAVISCPAFVADCLETIEELGMRAAKSFRENGGEVLTVVPAVNASDAWADAVVTLSREAYLDNPWGFAPADPPTRSLAGTPGSPLRSRGSLARSLAMRESVGCVVVGGGITGLAAAQRLFELGKELGEPLTVRLLERSDRLGGLIRTERVGEYLIEGGPDSLVAHKPAAARLAERIGLARDLAATGGRHPGTEIVWKGRPIRVPDGFLMMAPTRLWPALRSPLFSIRGKLRMACEPWIPAREADVEDESLASFVTRRFGREVLERVAEPIVAGIYTARAENLSLRLTLPRFLDMEMREGSVSRALRKAALAGARSAVPSKERSRRATSDGGVQGSVLALKGGLGRIVDELASRLPDGTVETGALVDAIVYDDAAGVWRVRYGESQGQGRELRADALVLACSATVSAAIVRALDAELSSMLAELEYASCATVTLAYPVASIGSPLRSNGFFVPRAENLPILACSYVSRKFEDRGPEDTMVLRAFLGGATNPAVLEHDDDQLVSLTHATLARLLEIRHAPVLARVYRFPGSMPQYRPGQARWIAGIRSRSERHPGLFFAGSTLGAFGLPDCIQSGEDAASAVVAFLSSVKRAPSMARED